MADVAAQSQTTQKKKTTKKPAAPAQHPKYNEMVVTAIKALKERNGSSRLAILNYIVANFKVGDAKSVNTHLKMALKSGVQKNVLKQTKGVGASGSFRVNDTAAVAKPKKAASKKVAKPKSATPKKTVKKASSKKSPAKPKKTSAKKSPKKPAAKKSAKKPASKNTPKKATAKKTVKKAVAKK